MNKAPEIASSTREERAAYVDSKYHCISDCDMCGLCKVFHGKDPMLAFKDYIDGVEEMQAVAERYR